MIDTLDKENIILNEYFENNNMIYYDINNIPNQFYIKNDFLRFYNKLYCLNFDNNKTIKKDEKIQIILKIPTQIIGKYIKYYINDFCLLTKKDKKIIRAYLVIETNDKTYEFNTRTHKFITIKTDNIITDLLFIINFTADINYNNVKSIGYKIYFEPRRLHVLFKKNICRIDDIIKFDLNLKLKIMNYDINIEYLNFEKTDLKLFDYTKLKGKITSNYKIKEYKIKDVINKKYLKLKNEYYDKELEKYIYTLSENFILEYGNQITSLYKIYIMDCNYYFIKVKRVISINFIKE